MGELRIGNAPVTDENEGSSTNPKRRRAALAGLVFVLALVVAGLFLARELRGVSQLQDCVMAGRTNCAPIDSGAGN
ncbi:MAG TPA: hypothetical protein VN821_14200 [Candidatus Udaeobacter sp.]|nr:hypothetical protein [Candidatus Udaeobacter sp.]